MINNYLFEEFNYKYKNIYIKLISKISKREEDTSSYSGLSKDIATCFIKGDEYILWMDSFMKAYNEGIYNNSDFNEALKINNKHFLELLEDYDNSAANPKAAAEIFKSEDGKAFSYIYARILNMLPLIIENRLGETTALIELWDKAVCSYLNKSENLKELIYEEALNNMEERIEIGILRKFHPEFNCYKKILLDADLTNLNYLFGYGMYIGSNEIETAKYILSLPEDKINRMADVMVQGFIRGYENGNKSMPLSDKKTINLSYPIGFERLIRAVADRFKAIGLEPLVYTDYYTATRPRIIGTKCQPQFPYDHRFDDAMYFDKNYAEKYQAVYENLLDKHQDKIKVMAGPAVQEAFGEEPFSPISKKENISFSEEQTELKNSHTAIVNKSFKKYLPGSAYSFVIITYPYPSIGDEYKKIFDEIIEINTLDNNLYQEIHKKLIDVLDLAEFVHIKGKAPNKTDMYVKLHYLENPEKQTNFENCTADVNIPVGEVFTSPLLTDTNGIINVSRVYLDGLRYDELEIVFKDGMVDSYTCKNFENEEDNKKYVFENLLHPHKTLPLGEFAIGTNTKAYVMSKRYQIEHVLPILIAEKLGPHFAIGDTCYSWSEDQYVCNLDGKEIIARDNEKSVLRKTDIQQAYTYKHTDITIPYDELELIEAISKSGEKYTILEQGRFTTEGTQYLNKAFE